MSTTLIYLVLQGHQADRETSVERYKAAKRDAKKVVAKAKDKAYKGLYKKLDSIEGANDIYRIAKAREEKKGFDPEEAEKDRTIAKTCNSSATTRGSPKRVALKKMGSNKAVGPDQIHMEAWKCLGGEGVKWLTCLFNKIFQSAKMPDEWRLGEVIPIYKNKGDAQVYSNYRGRSTIEAIHLLRSLMEKYREKQRDLHLASLDLEKVYDSVLRELIWRTLIDKGTPRRYLRVIRDMYEGAKTRIRTTVGNTDFFPVEVGLHQDLPLSQSAEGDVTTHNEEVDIRIGDQILQPKESFRYLGSVIHKSGRIDDDVTHRIRAGVLAGHKSASKQGRSGGIENAKVDLWKNHARHDPNGVFRTVLEVETISSKTREGRLWWFRHVRRRPQQAPVRRVKALIVNGKKKGGRPKLRWEDRLKLDIKELLLSEDMTSDGMRGEIYAGRLDYVFEIVLCLGFLGVSVGIVFVGFVVDLAFRLFRRLLDLSGTACSLLLCLRLGRFALPSFPLTLKEGLRITGAAMVNLRPSSGLQEITELMKNKSGSRWGNKFGMMLLPIYYHKNGSDPLQYLKRAKTMIDRKKLSLEAYLSYKIGYFVMKVLGAKFASLLNYRIVCNTTFTISNVVGPKEEFMIAGIPVTYIRATSTSMAHAITMHMVSYAGKADMQILVAKELIPHPEKLAKCFEDALLGMKEAALKIQGEIPSK
ncbi:retrovirus-related pol polyprotein LINE-1 [Tanacetum coccineum]